MKIKRILCTICIALLSVLSTMAQSSVSSEAESNSLAGLTFSVSSNKAVYLPYEPLFVTFELTNKTQTSYVGVRPLFLIHSSVQVTDPDGQVTCIRGLSLSSGGGTNLPDQKFEIRPGESFAQVLVPAIGTGRFEKLGKYTLLFSYSGLESKSIEISIAKPLGLDGEAFYFLEKHGKDLWFGQMLQEKNGAESLKTFVRRFESTSYGDLAVFSLGKYYLNFEKDSAKAQIEFSKLLSSKNTYIADNAAINLAEIASLHKD